MIFNFIIICKIKQLFQDYIHLISENYIPIITYYSTLLLAWVWSDVKPCFTYNVLLLGLCKKEMGNYVIAGWVTCNSWMGNFSAGKTPAVYLF